MLAPSFSAYILDTSYNNNIGKEATDQPGRNTTQGKFGKGVDGSRYIREDCIDPRRSKEE